eukprot:gene14547-biopygen12645
MYSRYASQNGISGSRVPRHILSALHHALVLVLCWVLLLNCVQRQRWLHRNTSSASDDSILMGATVTEMPDSGDGMSV